MAIHCLSFAVRIIWSACFSTEPWRVAHLWDVRFSRGWKEVHQNYLQNGSHCLLSSDQICLWT